MALSFFSRMVSPCLALSSLLVSENSSLEQVCRAISPVTVFALVRPHWQLIMASLITLFRPWVVGLVLLTSCTFAPHPSRWLHSLLSSLLAQLARNPGICRKSRRSQEIMRTSPPQFLRVVGGLCQARTPLINWEAHRSFRVQFLHQAEPSCLTAGGAVADLALVPPFHLASVSGLLSLISCSASRYSGKCCPVSHFELGVGACVNLGGGAGSTSSLFAAPLPSKHPWVVFGWWPLADLLWRPVCSRLSCFQCPFRLHSASVVEAKSVVRNLGSWFDRNLDMSSHISKLCASAFYHLHNISRTRRSLSTDTTKALVHAFVTTHVDYCNSLLYGLPASHLNRVQRVLNAAARLVCRAPRYCRITPLLCELHWLPVRQRISFKILLFVFKAIHGFAPTYLRELVSIKRSVNYNLRSSSDGLLLATPSYRSRVTLGDRSFQVAAPALWNILLGEIRSITDLGIFKRNLKTHLFSEAFY